jgi:uncharacterized protein YfaS (alpha-2-macroglobulin family)
MTAKVSVGTTTIGTEAFEGRSTAAREMRMAMPALSAAVTATSSPSVVIEREGSGRLYYSVRLQTETNEPSIEIDRGLHVARRYQRVAGGVASAPSTTFAAGDLVKVTLTLTVRGEGRFLALSDSVPAGFEPLDELFATTARQDLQEQAGDGQQYLYRWWEWSGFEHVEKHDDRVVAFATRLPTGRHEFSYFARAATAGTFKVGAARAEAMYAPELEGRTAAGTIVIK